MRMRPRYVLHPCVEEGERNIVVALGRNLHSVTPHESGRVINCHGGFPNGMGA